MQNRSTYFSARCSYRQCRRKRTCFALLGFGRQPSRCRRNRPTTRTFGVFQKVVQKVKVPSVVFCGRQKVYISKKNGLLRQCYDPFFVYLRLSRLSSPSRRATSVVFWSTKREKMRSSYLSRICCNSKFVDTNVCLPVVKRSLSTT